MVLKVTIEEVMAKDEKQIFDRKSIHIRPADLSETICAFANADGGTIAVGISDKKRRIEGVDYNTEQLNEILRTPIDFCNPTVPITTEMVECINAQGEKDHVLLMHIEASPLLHANQADEVYYRVGDKSKKLNFEQRMQLVYAKGEHYYEDAPVNNASWDDLDMTLVDEYVTLIGYSKGAKTYIRENGFIIKKEDYRGCEYETLSGAAVLLFGKNP
jgi:ATP-dependent DNA helicase RecG